MTRSVVEGTSGCSAKFVGPEHISAKLLTASSLDDPNYPYDALYTFELTYPRFIHAQIMTHRMFARNSASNRARSIAKPGSNPIVFYEPPARLRVSGMRVAETCTPEQSERFSKLWRHAAMDAYDKAVTLERFDYAKELVNRLIEPFQFIEVVMTGTITWWAHFLALRNHPDAQFEIRVLASKIAKLFSEHKAVYQLYHLPYVDQQEFEAIRAYANWPCPKEWHKISMSDLVVCMISAARCARVSYTPFDEQRPSIEKDLALAVRLLTADPPHMSPFEHQAALANNWNMVILPPLFESWVTARHVLERWLLAAKAEPGYFDTLLEHARRFAA